MYTLPLMPYYGNLANHWREHSNEHLDYDFWSWVKKTHAVELDSSVLPEVWQFGNERDMMMFALRWS